MAASEVGQLDDSCGQGEAQQQRDRATLLDER